MSGLVVRPGDTVVIPLDGRSGNLTPDHVEAMRAQAQTELPGVKVAFFQGMVGSAFVYRPDPPAMAPKTPPDTSWIEMTKG